MRTVVFIPAYNAEKFLPAVVEKIPESFARKDVLIVDDGSKDNTYDVANTLGTVVVRHTANKGYGGAQKTAYNYAIENNYDAVIMLHADGQHNPLLLPDFVDMLEKYDAVTGTRFGGENAMKQGMPIQRYVGNRVLSVLIRVMTGLKVSEMHNGYRGYRISALKAVRFNDNSDKYEFDTEILLRLKSKGLKIGEVPIETIYKDEESHLNIYTYGSRLLRVVFRYFFLRKYRN